MKNIWLVGASEGIGRSLAIELSNEGHKLVLSGRNLDRLTELNQELDGKHVTIALDVSDNLSVKEAWEICPEIDTIIYCAGYYKPMSATTMEIEEVEKVINVNLVGALRVLNHVVPKFVSKKNGHIVLIGSISGYIGLPRAIGYGSSKAGIIHLAENLKCDLSKYNIKVQVINPGFVKTRLTDLNNFAMPSIISTEEAAIYIAKYMKGTSFESRFPFIVANMLKLLSKLPYWLYFKLVSLVIKD